ncbi:helix-turn-helix transcriptional regulator [Parapedobacter koreensis]|uniref:Predicted DNA-binding transcriptional regulator YafY, contains an HTH and WYL domains n=1 Tax=Parapedobacter koreensis TaxID=332977 RepID=A0A1H7J2H5_9SPHI|nr:YafY family protein [Parapedobacter koreensis]SEK68392.1 Predicted DNA-binding transcriptional regulator YafY, contains an HTH and WYL domains [Parapedobacter koreensis]
MNRIDRLFGMLTLLQSRRYVTGDQLAEKFAISIRTVYRDVKALNEQGIPVGFEPNKGYFVVEGYFLRPVSFNLEEANALLLMENLLAGFADKSIQKHYSNALNKVKAVMRDSQREKLEYLVSNTGFQLPRDLKGHDYEHLSALQEAIVSKTILEIRYCKGDGEESGRRIEPVGLIFYALNWHVIGWCYLRKDYRDFRVSRIVSLRNTGLPFEQANHPPITEFMKQLPVDY